MSIRSTLLANITAAISTTSVNVASELPWASGGVELYNKNMKKFYLSEEQRDIIPHHRTLDRNDVFQTETLLTGYLTVDAKNQPSDIDTVVTAILNSKNAIADQFITECLQRTEIAEDRLTRIFEFRFTKINLQGDP